MRNTHPPNCQLSNSAPRGGGGKGRAGRATSQNRKAFSHCARLPGVQPGSWALFTDAPAIGSRKGRPAAPSFHPPSCPGCGAPARCGLGWLVTAFCPGGREEGGGRFLFLLEEGFSAGFLVLTSNPTSPPPDPPLPPPHPSS